MPGTVAAGLGWRGQRSARSSTGHRATRRREEQTVVAGPFARFDGHEQVVFGNDDATGLRCIVAIHSTRLGPAVERATHLLARAGEMARYRPRIVREIEAEVVGRTHFQGGKVRKRLKNDPEIEEAVQLLRQPDRYRAILKM